MLALVLEDGSRVPVAGELLLGRDAGSDVLLEHPTISRAHARVRETREGATVEDAGSRYGTWLDGDRVTGAPALHEGALLQLGDLVLAVERRRPPVEAGVTVVMAAAASTGPALAAGLRVTRLAATEGPERWVVHDPARGVFLRVEAEAGQLLELLDGRRPVSVLLTAARDRLGAGGPGRLVALLGDLADRGLLEGTERPVAPPERNGLFAPRVRELRWAPAAILAVHRRLGRGLLSRPALGLFVAVAVAGLAAAVLLVARRYGTPLVVASHLGLGGLVFLAGRGLVVAIHELVHGLVLARYGRPVTRAGFKVVLVFPYAFVDTSEAWLEPRGNRIAVSAAGPASDVVLGGAFALACLALPAGTVRDICFQVAFSAYVGAAFNANPLLDRDGYHVLVDLLRAPRLRERARAQLARRLAGQRDAEADPVLRRYGTATLVWSILAVAFAILFSMRYVPELRRFAPDGVVWSILAVGWAGLLLPLVLSFGRPLWRRRGRAA